MSQIDGYMVKVSNFSDHFEKFELNSSMKVNQLHNKIAL